MGDTRPVWRRVFDEVEHRVGPRLEEAARSEQFADAAAALARLQSGAQRRLEQALRRGWHFWNLPAGSDVKRLSEQVASLERRVRALSKQLEDAEAPGRPAPSTPGRSTKGAVTGARRPRSQRSRPAPPA
jgi:hypothetical protein